MMSPWIGLSLAGILLAAGVATAQTGTSTPTTPSPTTTQPAATSPTTPSSAGAFAGLSPGNQRIVQALCAAQSGGCPTSEPARTQALDGIAALKPKGMGWGEFFHQNRDLFPGAKNLGDAVSKFNEQQRVSSPSSETTSATGGGHTSEGVGGKGKSEGAISKGHDDQGRPSGSAVGSGSDRGQGGRGAGAGQSGGRGRVR